MIVYRCINCNAVLAESALLDMDNKKVCPICYLHTFDVENSEDKGDDNDE